MPYRIAHAVRGRLRVRYPANWLDGRQHVLESALRALPGVRSVEGRTVTGSLRIAYDPFRLAEDRLIASLTQMTRSLDSSAGAAPVAVEPRPQVDMMPAPLATLLGASTALAGVWLPLAWPVHAGLVLAAGLPSLLRGARVLMAEGRLNGDVLEASTLALLTARGNFPAAALLGWFRALGDYIVAKTVVTTRRSLRGFIAAPSATITRTAGEPRGRVRVGDLGAGDVIAVTAGERLPIDGTVVRGEALVDQQTLTGEVLPVERRSGDQVFAATSVVHGEIAVRVDRVGFDTAVGRIIAAVEVAAAEKSDIQVFAERLADREINRTLVLAGLGATFSRSLDAGVAILVADYGMAARVGIPTAVMTSMKRAAGEGILIKGPRALENLARVNTVVFDKTGTLTSGVPHVGRIVSYDRSVPDTEVLRLAAVAEHGFRHPVARAIARLASTRGLAITEASSRAERVGLGVDVRVGEREVLVGSRRFMDARAVDLERAARDEADAHAAGAAATFVAVDGRLAGMLVLRDALRDDARQAVQALRARRMRNVIMLSGDHAEPTRVMAESLGLRHYYGEQLPEDKAALIRRLKGEGRVVAMVGDGVNDALALNEADVGIAVPGGAEVAAEAADVVILRGGLDRVVRALDVAAESIVAVRRTLRIAAQANLGVVALASLGLARPLTSILVSHGTTVSAALALAARPDRVRGRGRRRGKALQ